MNEFVNPQHRGVNLPAGCKDLMDVLKGTGVSDVETPIYALHSRRRKPLIERYETNGLQRAEKFVRQLLASQSKKATLVFFLKSGRPIFTFVRSPDFVKTIFCFSKGDVLLEQSVGEIFTKFAIVPLFDASFLSTDQNKVVGYSVPDNVSGLLEIAGELLRGAFGVPDSDGLVFMFQER